MNITSQNQLLQLDFLTYNKFHPMKKSIILLSLTAIVAIVASFTASKARTNFAVYIHAPSDPEGICSLRIYAKTFFTSPNGPNQAAAIPFTPCVAGTILDAIN